MEWKIIKKKRGALKKSIPKMGPGRKMMSRCFEKVKRTSLLPVPSNSKMDITRLETAAKYHDALHAFPTDRLTFFTSH